MKLELERTNDAELRARELKLREDLEGGIGEVPLSLERLRVLAEVGWLSASERRTYDELARVKRLLGEPFD